jgi:undecaprenyl-diphosphatase
VEIIRAIVLGIVQGATEFIPVSSSGHLVLVPWLLGWPSQSLLFDTMLHWGTLVSILVVFGRDFLTIIGAVLRGLARRSLREPEARLGWYIVAGSIPAAGVGLFFKDFFEALFASPTAAGGFLFLTAAVLVISEQIARRATASRGLEQMRWRDAIGIGVAQAIALAPGISRSGMTIATGLASGFRRDVAARYSFLLGTPAFFGAGLLQLIDVLREDATQVTAQVPELAVGLIVSALTGILAIRFLLAYLRKRSLYIFAIYCVIAGALVIGLAAMGW